MSTITEINKLSASDLQSITGLKQSYAQECVNLFGSYAPALASFVQSFNELPEAFFDNRQQTLENAQKINTQLRLIYQRARELKKENGQSDDKAVWKCFANSTTHPQEFTTHTKLVNDGPFASFPKPVFGSEAAKPFALPQNSSSPTTQLTSPFGSLNANTGAQGTSMPSAFTSAFANSKWNANNNSNFTSSVFSAGNSSNNNSSNNNKNTTDKNSSDINIDNTDNSEEKKVNSVFSNSNNNSKANSSSTSSSAQTKSNPFAEIAAQKAAPASSAFGQVKSNFAGTATQYKSVFSTEPSKPSPSTVVPTAPFTSSSSATTTQTRTMPQKDTPANTLPSILGEPPASSQSDFVKVTSNAAPINNKTNKNAAETSTSTKLAPPPTPPPYLPAPAATANNIITPITTNKSRFFDPAKNLTVTSPFTSSAANATSPPVLSQPNAPVVASTPTTTSIFGFGAALQMSNATQPNVYGFGQTNATTATATNTEAAFTAGAKPQEGGDADVSSNNTSAADASLSTKAAAKPVRYCTPTHFTGPFFEMPTFWETEVVERAPLLNLNCGFLESNKDHLRERLLRWVKKAEFYNKPVKYVAIDDDDEKVVRVIIKDADRTFFQSEHRAKLVAFLHAMYHEFKAYGQAMSYLAGLCMLVLNEQETATVIRFVATQYIRGHWAEEAVGFSTNAWVVEYFMQKQFPDVAAHMLALNLWPDTYLQKILTGLCIHMLRFNELFEFLDAFIEGGIKYLIRFCLALVEHFRADILAVHDSKDCGTIYEIMRLDPKVTDQNDVRQILNRVSAIDLGEEGNVIDLIRSQMYESKVEPRLKRAPKAETFEPCAICDKHRPKWWNDDMGAVCDSCRDANPTVKFEKY